MGPTTISCRNIHMQDFLGLQNNFSGGRPVFKEESLLRDGSDSGRFRTDNF